MFLQSHKEQKEAEQDFNQGDKRSAFYTNFGSSALN